MNKFKCWIILWKPKQELPPFETVMGSDEISLLSMRNSQLTFVPSASAKPPPTSRTTFHGMAAWNSPQEIMASSWREIKTHPAHIFTSTDSCCPTTQKTQQQSRSHVQNIRDYGFIIIVVTPSCSGGRSVCACMCVLSLFTVCSGGSVGRYDEEEETQQQSHGGISDVAGVTDGDKNRRNWYTDSWVSGYSQYMTLITEMSWNVWSVWGVTHWGRREAQPGMKPGDLVNHNNTITRKTPPVNISWELDGKTRREDEWMSNWRVEEQTERQESVDQTAANWRKETKNKNLRQKHRSRITVESLCWSVGPIPQLLVSINN